MKITELYVKEHGFSGTLYDPNNGSDKVIIVFIGSEGSFVSAGFISERFADFGFSALALYYFGGVDLPNLRAQIPMEFAQKAVSYLKGYDNCKFKKIGTYGDSIGSMPALMSGVLFNDISCVIAVSPTHVVTEGFLTRKKLTGNSFLTYGGEDIPYLPLPPGMKMYEMFQTAYKDAKSGNIPVERIQGRILLLASEMDEAWPAASSVRSLESRLKENLFSYPHKASFLKKRVILWA